MKTGYTDITIILDRSGSMNSVAEDTIGGFNSFLKNQKEVPGHATISLVQFDDQYDVVYTAKVIGQADNLSSVTFVPRGNTALLDAIGRTIKETGERYAAMPEPERPEKVIVVIITDGFENASHKYTKAQINDMIKTQTDSWKWNFVFLGANQDAIAEAGRMGISAQSSMTYSNTKEGNTKMYASLNKQMTSLRCCVGQASFAFDAKDRSDQEEELKK